MTFNDNGSEALPPASERGERTPLVTIEQLTAITHPQITEAATSVIDILANPENSDPETLREAWVNYALVTEAFVDSLEDTPEDPQLRAKGQIAAIINKAYIFQATGNVTRYLEELDTAEVYAANEGFDGISEVLTTEISSQVEQLKLSPEVIILKLKGILSDDNREFLKEELDEGLDIDDLIGQVYSMLLNEAQDPDEVLIQLGIIE